MYVSASPFPVAVRQRANESAQYAPLLPETMPSFPEADQLIRGKGSNRDEVPFIYCR